jgi:hypothetical protein
MRLQCVMSVFTILCGMFCLGSAMDSDVTAVDCNPVLHSPATCKPAHEEANVTTSTNVGCDPGEGLACIPRIGSLCGEIRWGRVVPGTCKIQPAGSAPWTCTANDVVTVVELHKWTSECIRENGICTCSFEADMDGPSENIEVCECSDGPSQ